MAGRGGSPRDDRPDLNRAPHQSAAIERVRRIIESCGIRQLDLREAWRRSANGVSNHSQLDHLIAARLDPCLEIAVLAIHGDV